RPHPGALLRSPAPPDAPSPPLGNDRLSTEYGPLNPISAHRAEAWPCAPVDLRHLIRRPGHGTFHATPAREGVPGPNRSTRPPRRAHHRPGRIGEPIGPPWGAAARKCP